MRRNSAHFSQSQTLRVCSFKTMLAFLAFVCIKISLIYPFLNSGKTGKQLSVKTRVRRNSAHFFSHRQAKRQNCQKQSFSRQKSSKYCVFCSVTYSPSMLPLNKTCLSCFFLLKTNTIDNLAFFRKPLQNNACLSCIYLHKNLAYLSFSQLVKTGKQLSVKTERCVEIRRIFA